MRTTPRVILILKQASSATRRCESLAKKIAMTWWQELQNRHAMAKKVAVTWWQEFRERVFEAVTWWQELQNTEQTRNGQKDRRDMVTGVQSESLCDHDMMTGATEQIRSQHDTYCSPGTSSGKQKKNRSTSQPQFRSENTPATIEADKILLALQQLANNNNSANFPNNINRISKLPKSLTTTMPTFDGKCEKFELFEDLFPTSLKIHNQLTEEDRINYFHSLMRGDALQTFKNINGPTRENLREILPVFRRKYVKSQWMATAKHKFQQIKS